MPTTTVMKENCATVYLTVKELTPTQREEAIEENSARENFTAGECE
jgi:hypothetical protein